jgi:DNA-binding transcriptional LysR family regulator
MELRQLEYFAAVAEHLNFHRAARGLGVSQPTLSQQLKALERECGVMLVARDQHSVRLTDAGQAFLGRVAGILAGVKAAKLELSALASRGGQLTIGTFGSERITKFLAEFVERHPETDLVVQQQSYQQTMKLVAQRRLDAGLLQMHPTGSSVPAGVVVEQLAPVRVGLIMRPDHPLAQRDVISIEDLRRERLILPSSLSAPRVALELALKNANVVPERTPYLTTASATMASLVAKGLGIGVMAEAVVTLVSHRLVFRGLDHPDAACWIAIAWAAGAAGSEARDAFIRFAHSWRWTPRRKLAAAAR